MGIYTLYVREVEEDQNLGRKVSSSFPNKLVKLIQYFIFSCTVHNSNENIHVTFLDNILFSEFFFFIWKLNLDDKLCDEKQGRDLQVREYIVDAEPERKKYRLWLWRLRIKPLFSTDTVEIYWFPLAPI
jgi:hypothetical protein